MFKKIIALILAGFITITSFKMANAEYIRITVKDKFKVEQSIEDKKTIVIRVGEYPNKPGKRVFIPKWYSLDTNKYPLNEDGTLSEYYVNKYIAEAIVTNLKAINKDINVILQESTGKSDDLNAAGRIALNNKNLKMYVGVHTNASEMDARGQFLITGKNSTYKNNIKVENISNAIRNDKMQQRHNNYNVNYIGELNEIPEDVLAMVGEFGFYSNLKDLRRLTDEEYINNLAKSMAESLNETIKNL